MSIFGYRNKNQIIKTAARYVLILFSLLIGTALLATLLPQQAKAEEPPAWTMPEQVYPDDLGLALFNINGVMQICALHTEFLTDEGEQVGSCSDFVMVISGFPVEASEAGVMPPQTVQEVGVLIFLNVDEVYSENSSFCAVHSLELTIDGRFPGTCAPIGVIFDFEPYEISQPKWDLKPGEGSPDGTEFSI